MNQPKNVEQALLEGKKRLRQKGIDCYALDVELILMKAANLKRIELFTKNELILDEIQWKRYTQMLSKRENGMPTQYITEECEFMGLSFLVNESVLVPRPETELLVEKVIEYSKKERLETVLDMGTGSGCIPISLAYYLKELLCYGVDISKAALVTAKKNALSHQLENRVHFFESDLFQNIPNQLFAAIDVLVSNPPYIATKEIEGLMREVRDFEPRNALDGGEDGLMFYRILVKQGKRLLKNNGCVFFEIGFDQGEPVCDLLLQEGFEEIALYKDLAGLDRLVCARKRD